MWYFHHGLHILNNHHGANVCAWSGQQHDASGYELTGRENDVLGCFWWIISDLAQPFVHFLSQQHVLSLCIHSMLESTFMYGFKAGKGVYIISMLILLHRFPPYF